MPEEFEDRDLGGAVFWGVDLRGATFRDVDLTDVSISHARVVNVSIDALIDRVTINGVDVTDYVNTGDQWYPLRAMLRPGDLDGMRTAWDELGAAWATTMTRAAQLPPERLHESVDGEWSFVQTLRHLVFAMDKWFTVPILGGGFDPMGLPNTFSIDFGFPGLDLEAAPTFEEVCAVRAARADRLREFLDAAAPADLDREVDVPENGANPVRECLYTVFEEEFEHNRYAVRDLARL
jgi:hypothetical protein